MTRSMIWRYVLAGILSMLVLIGWSALQPPPPPPAPPAPAAGPVIHPLRPPLRGGEEDPARGPVPPADGTAKGRPERPVRERKEITVADSPHFAFVADSRGATLSKVYLPEFHESVEKKGEPYQILFPLLSGPGTFSLEIEGVPPIPLDENWQAQEVREGDGPASAVLENEVDGISIVKRVLPGEAGDYPVGGSGGPDPPRHIKLRLQLTNRGAEPKAVTYSIHGPCGLDTESLQGEGVDIELAYGFWGRGDRVHADTLLASDLKPAHWERGERIAWVGASNNYFTSILFPISPGGARAGHIEKAFAVAYPDARTLQALAKNERGKAIEDLPPNEVAALAEKSYKNLRTGLRAVKLVIKPGETVTHEYGLYVGPRERSILDRYATLNFQGVNQYGMFSFLVKFFIWLLGLLKVIAFGSWGLAIILLTLIVKACLHPINRKSQAGMMRFQKKMQRVKPEMDEIKERYGQNRLKMNQEIQKLWKKHEINPGQQMAGCLMIFLQLPIWFGLYRTLQYAIGLRQAEFLYIEDLTRPDQLFSFGVSLPFIGEWFNLLPVLYVILTVVNQRLQPRPEDPQMLAQYRMMTFMMIFFGFIFYSFPAGFMLYIMTSAALGIIESKIIKAELARDETLAAPPAEGTPPGDAGRERMGGALYPARARKPGGGPAGTPAGPSSSRARKGKTRPLG